MGTSFQVYLGGKDAEESLKYQKLANSRLAARAELEKQIMPEGKTVERKDTFHYLLTSKDPVTGKVFTKEELQADSALIIAAGSDGVGMTISACMFYLLKNPSAVDRLVWKFGRVSALLGSSKSDAEHSSIFAGMCRGYSKNEPTKT
jgi:cytochrome P450